MKAPRDAVYRPRSTPSQSLAALGTWIRPAGLPPPATAIRLVGIQESVDGKAVDWLEPVSDAQYLSAPIREP